MTEPIRRSSSKTAKSIGKRKESKSRKSGDNDLNLTAEKIQLIRSAWGQIVSGKSLSNIGYLIVQRLFFKAPMIKESFYRVPLPEAYRTKDQMFRDHCDMVGNFVDFLVKGLDNVDELTLALDTLGRQHAHLAEYSFKPQFWNAFSEAFMDCTLEWGEIKSKRGVETAEVWSKVISYVTTCVKASFTDEIRSKTGSVGPRPRKDSSTGLNSNPLACQRSNSQPNGFVQPLRSP